MSDTPPDSKPILRGRLEQVVRNAIAGWAMDPAAPGAPVTLELLIDGIGEGRLAARMYRADLEKAGIGEGRHGFQITIPGGLSPARAHEIRVRHAEDGRELLGSPFILAAETGAADARLTAAAIPTDPAEREALIATLAEQAAALLLADGSAMPDPPATRLARISHAAMPPPPPDDRPVALFIDEGIPAANRDADSSRALTHLLALQRLGFRVHVVATAELIHAGAATRALEAQGITCWHAPWIGSVEEVLRRLGPSLRLAYLHRFAVMQRYGALVRHWCPGARLVYDVADLHYLRAARRIAIEAGLPAGAPAGAHATAGLRAAELMAALGADAVITHSSYEAALLRRDVPDAEIHLIAREIPPRPVTTPIAARRGVAFIGSYGHAPNVDAAHVLLEQIMPLVWAENPTIPCLIAGSDMPVSLREAVARVPDGRAEALGWVASLDELFARVRITAAPLRYGAGLKGKVLDSLAAGLPCVCSPMAVEGMDLPAALDPLIGTTNIELAAAILGLHADDAAYATLADIGLNWVASTLSRPRIDALFRQAVMPA